MLIDHIKLTVAAGKGGDGVVRWRREKGIPFGGPAGGDGGKGADVYLHVVRDIHALARYKHKTDWKADDGESGKKRSMHGLNANDLYLDVPLGSIIHNDDLDITYECIEEDANILILRGGRGGYGNEKFKSSINRTPEEFTPGAAGEYATFSVELDLIADIGIIGLPNAGKSSLLNSFTRAGAKVADYAFTTLEPNLGAYHGIILADIPGLIEGASDGRGLGHKFLKHIRRTGILLHLVSAANADIVQSYKTVRDELGKFDQSLLTKKEIVVLSQSDLISKDKQIELLNLLQKAIDNKNKTEIFAISLFEDESINDLGTYIRKIVEVKTNIEQVDNLNN